MGFNSGFKGLTSQPHSNHTVSRLQTRTVWCSFGEYSPFAVSNRRADEGQSAGVRIFRLSVRAIQWSFLLLTVGCIVHISGLSYLPRFAASEV